MNHPPDLNRLYDRAQLWIERGRPARARRLLRHYIYQFPVDERFFRLGAQLELEAGNQVEAGRLLWLIGSKRKADKVPINAFRVRRGCALHMQVPSRMRRADPETLPRNVAKYAFDAPAIQAISLSERVLDLCAICLGIAVFLALAYAVWIGLRSTWEGLFGG